MSQHHLKRGGLGVGAQQIGPVKARVFGDPRLVDGEVLGRDGLEIPAETAVADERLVASGELGAQPVEDGTALLGIAPRLGEIATDDVPSVADFDLLGLELGELARNPRHDQRDKGCLITITVLRTSALLRSRTPRRYSSLRSSSAAILWALIMPRSATTQMRPTLNRPRNRSTTGNRVVTSAVLPGPSSQHSGLPS